MNDRSTSVIKTAMYTNTTVGTNIDRLTNEELIGIIHELKNEIPPSVELWWKLIDVCNGTTTNRNVMISLIISALQYLKRLYIRK